MEISVIIPAYNEESIIKKCVANMHAFLSTHYKEFEIIVVDDGSKDDTIKLISNMNLSNLHIISYFKNRGKGFAVRKGVFAATGDCIVYYDADIAYSPNYITACMNSLKHSDIAIGSRYIYANAKPYENDRLRRFLSKSYNFLIKLFLRIKASDVQCGFKGFKANVAREVFARQNIKGYAFDIEILKNAQKSKFDIVEFPIKQSDEPSRPSKVRPIKDSFDMFVSIFKVLKGNSRSKKSEKGVELCQPLAE